MEKIQNGKYVELGFDLYRINADGSQTLMHQTTAEEPECIVYGVTQGVIGSLEAALNGLAVGDSYDVTAKCDEAFGPKDENQIIELDREIFVVEDKFDSDRVKPGAVLPMMTADGMQIPGIVKDVTDTKVVMDFNHPLAGHDIRIAGKVLVVRDATEEDFNPKGGCGCGCQGGCGDSGCGEGGCQGGGCGGCN